MTPHHTLAPTTDRTVPGAAPPPTREFPPHGPTLQQHVGHGLRPWLMLLAQFGRFARWASRFMAPASHGFPASAHAVRQRSYTLGLPPPLGDNACETLFTPQPFEHDPPLLFGGEPSPGRPTNIVNTRLRSPGRCLPRRPGGGAVSARASRCTPRVPSPSLRRRTFPLPVAPTRANVDGRRLLAVATKEGPSP